MLRLRWLVYVLLMFAGSTRAAAQQQPQPARPDTLQQAAPSDTPQQAVKPDTVRPKTAHERVVDRLLTIDRRVALDSARTDSIARDTTPARPVRQDNAPGLIPRDSIVEALLRMGGYTVTEYQADSARFDANTSELRLQGKPQVTQEGQKFGADSLLVYDQKTEQACGYGKPVLTTPGQSQPVQSTQLCYNVGSTIGVAKGAATVFNQGSTTWYVKGDSVFTVGSSRLYGHRAIFTDCKLETPHYHFGASEVKFVKNDVMVARNVTLNFADVPVFWLPFMMQSMKDGRRSGLLTPRFSVNDIARTNRGYNRRIEDVGLYWAINENLGAEVALDWFSNNYVAYRGSFDYRFTRRFLQGGLTFKQYNPTDGARVLTVAGQNSWQPNERTNVRMDANFASSSRFVRQRSFDPRELTQSITSTAGLSRRFDWGSLSLQGTRQQRLSDDQVDLTLPSLGINLSPLTLFKAPPTQGRFYNNTTLSASMSGRSNSLAVTESLQNPLGRDALSRSAQLSGGIQMGKISLQQSASYDRRIDQERPQLADSVPLLPRISDEKVAWSASLNYQQRLIGTSTLTPRLQIGGDWVRRDTAGAAVLSASAPLRLNFGADVRTDLFAFFPGFGPVERVRHRVSPGLGYTWSPAPQVTDAQRRVFGSSSQIRAQNRLALSFNQTFEAKMRDTRPDSARATGIAEQDSTSATLDSPRRLPQARKIMLLSVQTSAVTYDFVPVPDSLRARFGRDRYGLETTSLSNSVNSDLLRGFQLSFTHDLFRTATEGTGTEVRETRDFQPHLSNVSASFSISGDSWLFRTLGLRGRATQAPRPDTTTPGNVPQGGTIAPAELGPGLGGLIGRNTPSSRPTGPGGAWTASLNYTLLRPRRAEGQEAVGLRNNQMVQGSFNFKPTQNWSVHWNTAFSFTDKEFSDHILTLTRDLHDWEAHFDFVRAQNGNFSFQFRVNLRANPDIKFDYEQRDRRTQ
jgi:hypothetical protein